MRAGTRQTVLAVALGVCLAGATACGRAGGSRPAGDDAEGSTAALLGAWVVTRLDGEAAPEGLTMEVRADGLGGSAGCNRYNTVYTIEGDRIDLGPIASTRMACPEPEATIEYRFLTALEKVEGFRRAQETFELTDGAGAVLLQLRPDEATGP